MDTIKNARLKASVASIKAKTQRVIAESQSIQQQLDDEDVRANKARTEGMLVSMGYMPLDY
jgi:hypothetical protein